MSRPVVARDQMLEAFHAFRKKHRMAPTIRQLQEITKRDHTTVTRWVKALNLTVMRPPSGPPKGTGAGRPKHSPMVTVEEARANYRKMFPGVLPEAEARMTE